MMTREEFETFDTTAVEYPYEEADFQAIWGDREAGSYFPTPEFMDLYAEEGIDIRKDIMAFFRAHGTQDDVEQLGRIWWSDAVFRSSLT
jgi:hypothetical protein